MKNGGAQNRKQRAYEGAVALLAEMDLSPLFTLETYNTDRSVRQMVRCNKCGHEYGALIHKSRTTPCPNCANMARVAVIEGYYQQALETLRAHGYVPSFGRADFRGFKEKGTYIHYPVVCEKCGAEVAISPHPDFVKNCPECSSKLHQSYQRFLQMCERDGFTPITTFAEWTGHKRGVESTVRCNTCGSVFGLKWRPEYKIICKVCHANHAYRKATVLPEEAVIKCDFHKQLPKRVSKAERNAFIAEALAAQGLIPLFDVDANERPISSEKDGNTLFPVRCSICGREFETQKYRKNGAYFRKCSCQKVSQVFVCNREKWLREYLRDAGIPYLPCDRDALHGTEVDVLLPTMGIAFEFNGTFFHSASSKNPSRKAPSYHAKKTDLALANGIRLYHIWEDTPEPLARSIIAAKIGRSERVYARKLEFTDKPDRAEMGRFFANNHVDGNNAQAQYYFALTGADGRIYCGISLLKRRIQRSGKYQWEIGRFANLQGYTVVGGYSRLLGHAIALLRRLGATTLVSYCNRDLSPDPAETFYAKYGFELIGDSGPIYWYVSQRAIEINGRTYKGRISRQTVQKHKLLYHYATHGLPVGPDDTERTLAERLGLLPNYNSGNFRFELKL